MARIPGVASPEDKLRNRRTELQTAFGRLEEDAQAIPDTVFDVLMKVCPKDDAIYNAIFGALPVVMANIANRMEAIRKSALSAIPCPPPRARKRRE
jgi:hypothetical protein